MNGQQEFFLNSRKDRVFLLDVEELTILIKRPLYSVNLGHSYFHLMTQYGLI